jgi:Domain of Unknown Function (DUF326)
MHTQAMFKTHPLLRGNPDAVLIACIEACRDCAETCIICADACLGEEMVADLRRCIRLDQDCAEICTATAGVVTRAAADGESDIAPILAACIDICQRCGDECQRHAEMHAHCRICAEVCFACAAACHKALSNRRPAPKAR